MHDERRLILVVDSDLGFTEEARAILSTERVLVARSSGEAAEILPSGRVDLILAGPTHGSAAGISELTSLGPDLPPLLLAADLDRELLIAAIRSGVTDVLDPVLSFESLDRAFGSVLGAGLSSADPDAQDPDEVVIELESSSGPEVESSFTLGDGTPALEEAPPAETMFAPDPQWETAGGSPARAPEPETPAPAVPDAAPVLHAPSDPAPPIHDPEPTPPVHEPEPVAPLDASPAPQVLPAPPVAPPPMPDTPPPMEVPARAPGETLGESLPAAADVVTEHEGDVVIHPEGSPMSPAEPPPLIEEAASPRAPRSGRVVAVMAGKGGSGKTVTATNVALALALQRATEDVAIVDTDLQFGDVALLLQLDPTRTLVDVTRQIEDLTDPKLDSMLLRHESGLRVLPAPVLPVTGAEAPAKQIAGVINRLRDLYDVVVVDTPPVFDDHLVTVLETADDVLVVVDMDLPSVKNAKIALDALRGSGFPMERLRLVVNRVNAKARLDLVELERSLGLRVAGSIPSDRLVPQSVNEGIPVVALSPRSRVARAFHVLAGLIPVSGSRP